jgi:hypothetical protein
VNKIEMEMDGKGLIKGEEVVTGMEVNVSDCKENVLGSGVVDSSDVVGNGDVNNDVFVNEVVSVECNVSLYECKELENDLLVLPAVMYSKNVEVLIDGGSSGNFIAANFVKENEIETVPVDRGQVVLLPDGTRHVAGLIVKNVDMLIELNDGNGRVYKCNECVNLVVLPLTSHQVI